MQTRRHALFTKITILRNKSRRIRIVVPGFKVDQPGIFIMFLARKYLAVYGFADLAFDMPLGIVDIRYFSIAVSIGEIDGAVEAVMMLILGFCCGFQTGHEVGIAIMGMQ